MRISLWQQVSSNHSNSFTVIGRFVSGEAAQNAGNEIRRFLATLAEWYRRPENVELRQRLAIDELPLSPPEVAFSKKHNVDWGEHIDWLWPEGEDAPVKAYKDLVFVWNPYDTYTGATPFEAVVAKLGGEVVSYREDKLYGLYVNVACIAPNEAAAEYIYEIAHAGQATQKIEQPSWLPTQGLGIIGGEVKLDGLKLSFIEFERVPLERSLPELINYLEGKGCTDIQYSFVLK